MVGSIISRCCGEGVNFVSTPPSSSPYRVGTKISTPSATLRVVFPPQNLSASLQNSDYCSNSNVKRPNRRINFQIKKQREKSLTPFHSLFFIALMSCRKNFPRFWINIFSFHRQKFLHPLPMVEAHQQTLDVGCSVQNLAT